MQVPDGTKQRGRKQQGLGLRGSELYVFTERSRSAAKEEVGLGLFLHRWPGALCSGLGGLQRTSFASVCSQCATECGLLGPWQTSGRAWTCTAWSSWQRPSAPARMHSCTEVFVCDAKIGLGAARGAIPEALFVQPTQRALARARRSAPRRQRPPRLSGPQCMGLLARLRAGPCFAGEPLHARHPARTPLPPCIDSSTLTNTNAGLSLRMERTCWSRRSPCK